MKQFYPASFVSKNHQLTRKTKQSPSNSSPMKKMTLLCFLFCSLLTIPALKAANLILVPSTVYGLHEKFKIPIEHLAASNVMHPAIKVTKTYSGPTMSYTNTTGTQVGSVNFTTDDIPVGLILKDVDKAGTIYYVVVADGAMAPTAAVKEGTGNGGSSVITSGNAAVSTGDFTNDFNVIGLTEGTSYDVYVVAEDDESTPSLQASATLVNLTTLKPLANIVISEIMYNPPEAGVDEYEYIELYNAGTTSVDLTGYSFSKGVTHTFTSGSIGVGEYFVIAVNATKLDEAFGAGTADAQWTTGGLSNGGEEIELIDDVARVVDYVHYDDSSPWPTGNPGPDGYGTSIELRDVSFDNNQGASWAVSTDLRDIRANTQYADNLPMTGTPGLPAVFDNNPPIFENTKPAVASITKTGFILETDIDGAGTIYYVVVAVGANAPTATQVKQGTGNGGSSVITSGNAAVNTGNFTNDFNVIGLTEGTAYDVYVVAEDDEGTPNLQTNPTKVEVTTLTLAPTNNILYVNKNVSGGNSSGSSWANAIPELADALVWAHKNKANFSTTPLQIWVAGGTYKPMYSPEDGANFGTNQARDNSFLMVNNVQLYGGFAGTETTLADRDLSLTTNKTILSGDFNGDDAVTGSADALSITNNTENAYHVVISAGDVGTARIDGFNISGGNANGTTTLTINGTNFYKNIGGGIFNHNSAPLLTNLVIIRNTANGGGGIYNDTANTVLTNVSISKNTANFGGGMYNEKSNSALTNVIFNGNRAKDGTMPVSPCSTFTTEATCNGAGNRCMWWGICIETGNAAPEGTAVASGFGGGLYNKGSSPILTNVTFSKNQADADGSGMYNNTSTPKLYNNLLIGNLATTSSPGIYNENSTPVIHYSLIQDLTDTTNGNIDATNVTETDVFNDPTNGDYSLKAGSIAINAGNNALYTNAGGNLTTDKDVAGNKRVFQSIIDLGAYEAQALVITPDVNNIVYVNKTATRNGTGDSWANAIPELADALVWANNNKTNFSTTPLQIWVASGTYKPLYSPEDGANFGTDQSRKNAFLLVNNVQVYGGFAGTEIALSDRDLSLTANIATLSGDFDNDDIITGSGRSLSITENETNAVHVILSAGDVGMALIDGFTVTGGNANLSGGYFSVNNVVTSLDAGGGMINSSSSPTIKNITFTENSGDFAGGMYNNNSFPSIFNSTFSRNSSGGMQNSESSPNIKNTVFIDNNNGNDGGGIANFDSSSPTIINTSFIGNFSTRGGGIFNYLNSSPVIINTTFSENSTGVPYGDAIENQASYPKIYNSIVWGDIRNSTSTPDIKNSIVKGSSDTANGNIDSTGLTAEDIFNKSDNGDFSLNPFGPAINVGDNNLYAGTLATEKDLTGNNRLFAGLPDPDVIDLGAYELQGEPLKITPTDGILYVNKTATGNKTGDSWVNAIPELADALVWSKQNEETSWASTPLKIYVAKGIYKPLYSPEDGANFGTNQGRDNSFSMVKNVQVYGGFDPNNNINTLNDERILPSSGNDGTILSADVNEDDGSDFANNSENLIRVVVCSGEVGEAILNGFTIRGANGENNNNITVNGNPIYQCSGAGIYNSISSAVYENLLLQGNFNTESGGGIFSYQSSPKLRNIIFKNNKAKDGGAIASQDNSNPILTNVTFIGNTATNNGGAIYNVTNSSPTFVNSTVVNNTDTNGANGMHNADNSTPNVYNSIVWDGIVGSYQAENSIIEGSSDSAGNNIDATDLSAADIFTDPANGNYSLLPISPAVNTGDNSFYTTAGGDLVNDVDLADNPRIYDGSPETDIIDMGAYELQAEYIAPINPDANNIIYVNKTATGDQSGNSWANAIPELADALVWVHNNKTNFTTIPVQIWVAGGTYKPLYSAREGANFASETKDNAFLMVNNVQLYGGFAATETTLADRDLSLTVNKTTLSGDIGALNDNTDNANNVVVSSGAVGSARLDGFTVSDGSANDSRSFSINDTDIRRFVGGGMFNRNSSPTITNITFIGNRAKYYGGGMFNLNSSPTITNTTFISNSAISTNGKGGGMFNNNGSSSTITNTTFSGNTATDGSDMFNQDNSNPIVNNTIITGTVINDNATPVYKNSIIADKSYDNDGNETSTNLTVTDIFKDPANGDFSLLSSGPAFNSGSNDLYTDAGGDLENDLDLAGNSRLYDGVSATDIIDIGAYELQSDLPEDASFSYDAASYCQNEDDPEPTITGATGGMFSSTGGISLNAFTGIIDLSASTAGKYTVTYTTSGKTGAVNMYTFDVSIFELPIVSFTAPEDVCIGSGVQTGLAGGKPSADLTDNGIYSGPGVTDDGNDSTYSFDPETAGVGVHTITYTYTNANGCTNEVTDEIEVFDINTIEPIEAVNIVGTYTLPDITGTKLSGNEAYYTQPDGEGTAYAEADALKYTDFSRYPVTLYVYDASVHCSDQQSFELTIESPVQEGLKFADQSFTYDGESKSLVLTGEAEDATVVYENNDQIDAGSYIVIATVIRPNFTTVKLEGTLTINKAEATITADLIQTFTYDGTIKNISASLNHSETTLTYDSQQGYTDVGTYAISVDAIETENYLAASQTVSLVIETATESGLGFANNSFTYDGTAKSLIVTGKAEDATVVYENNDQTNAGTYNVIARVSRPNYQDAVLNAILTIDKAQSVITADATQTFTFDGTIKNISASLNHSETTLTYDSQQGYTDAGGYSINIESSETANYSAGSRNVQLVIIKASQTITFSVLANRNLENDLDFQLGATASSGLPITYSYTFTSPQPSATVSPEGFVVLQTSGQIQITATQSGNSNYQMARAVERTLNITSSNATASSITIDGQLYNNPTSQIYYLIDCDNRSSLVNVSLVTEPNAQLSTGNSFTIATPAPGIYSQEVIVTSQDGTQTRTYIVMVEKAFNFEDIVTQKYNNSLVVNNNPNTNGGYQFVSYEWFKNGRSAGIGQVFSEGNRESDILDPTATYMVKMTTVDGDVLQTCETSIVLKNSFSMVIGQNPIKQGDNLNVQADYPTSELKRAIYHIYSVSGRLIKSHPVDGLRTSINLPGNLPTGMYRLLLVTPERTVAKNFIKN